MSSEKKFGISRQPGNTCPDIDGLLDSIKNIGEEDEDGELIEISPDYSSWTSAQDNVDDLKYWQEEWLEIGEEALDRAEDIIKALNKQDNDEALNIEEEYYVEIFKTDRDYLESFIEESKENIEDWRKEIKSMYWDLESLHSSVVSIVDNNDENSAKEVEEYRSLVTSFRDSGNDFKSKIKDDAMTLLPEKCEGETFEDIFNKKIKEKEAEEELKQTMIDLKLTKKEKTRNKPKIK